MVKVITTQALQSRRYEPQLFEAEAPEKYVRLEGATLNYGMNMIPNAIARLPVGQSMSDAISTMERELDPSWFDNRRKKLRIGLTLIGSKILWSGDPFQIQKVYFEGYADAPNIVVTRMGYEIAIQLQHWSRDLALGSVLMEYSHPQHSDSAGKWSTWYPLNSSASQNGQNGQFHSAEAIPLQMGLPPGWQTQLPLDIWANGQKPILAHLALKPQQTSLLKNTQCSDAMNSPTVAAGEALKRIQGPSKELGSPYTTGVKPLELTGGAGADTRLVEAVAHGIAYHPLVSYSGSTFWALIQRFCGQFGLAFIPRVTDAIIQPIVLGLNDHYSDGQYVADQIADLNFADITPVGLRGMAVATQPISYTNANTVFNANNTSLMPSGCFFDSTDPNDGIVQWIEPPFWLNALHYHKLGGAQTSRQPRGDSDPDQGQPPTPYTGLSDMLNQYARMRFSDERLRNRMCQATVDVLSPPAPGSTIAITLTRLKSLSRYRSLIGLVTQVSTTIDRSAGRAVSTIALSGVRTLEEYNTNKYSTEQHPLFTSNYTGTSLLDL